ncbi:hypothetical protein HN419_06150 [Candidatus Woesearchaeota archaeon]|jgi:hypothetical protein|nr:hypothetical protein [Candidatus Woesearchaeota archaeon]MBT3538078.1 hypothetical protein [Candidatus Woesearchaeota archaeon]MBT7105747.1 hypothetical protein [Candidatus Woesearchaeota archaeon]MBT7930758.1 hypothetical protein [Candidatus Woesearchaeota archaeon]
MTFGNYFDRALSALALLALLGVAGCKCSNDDEPRSVVSPAVTSAGAQVVAEPEPKPVIVPPTPIDLDAIVFDSSISVLAKKYDANNNKTVAVILESHSLDSEKRVSEDPNNLQAKLYDAGLQLVGAGFDKVYAESLAPYMNLRHMLTALSEHDPSLDFRSVIYASSDKRAGIVRSSLFGRGVDTSLLLALTNHEDITFFGAETEESVRKQMRYAKLLTALASATTVFPGEKESQFDELTRLYRRAKKKGDLVLPDGATMRDLVLYFKEFNNYADYVKDEFDWWISGRSREMIDYMLESGDNGILFSGGNHGPSVIEHLDTKGVNYVVLCADCDLSDVDSTLRQTKDVVLSFQQYKKEVE